MPGITEGSLLKGSPTKPTVIAAVVVVFFGLVGAGCRGGSTAGGSGEGPPGVPNSDVRFSTSGPEALAFDKKGNLYVTDCYAARVFVIDPSGKMMLVAGSGPGVYGGGFKGDNGPASKARLFCPAGIALDEGGDLYVADHGNNRIRKIDRTGLITTFAGSGATGVDAGGFSGDGGPAHKARLQEPLGLALDGVGNLYVADRDNNAIRKITRDGVIATVAGKQGSTLGFSGDGGPATRATLSKPEGVAPGRDGTIYFSDSANGRVRKVDRNGVVTTIAGTGLFVAIPDGGPATKTSLIDPGGLAVDPKGNVYVSGDHRVRRIDRTGTMTTVAGTGEGGYSGDGGPATKAKLNTPAGLALDERGNLYIADGDNHRVRKVDTNGVITTFAG